MGRLGRSGRVDGRVPDVDCRLQRALRGVLPPARPPVLRQAQARRRGRRLLLCPRHWSHRLSDWQVSYHGIADAGVTGGTSVVIDVIRAFTTAAWAFELGAERIVLVQGIEEALELKGRLPGSLAMKDDEPL